jgi:peptide-methionine (S)-S-oxide reductase
MLRAMIGRWSGTSAVLGVVAIAVILFAGRTGHDAAAASVPDARVSDPAALRTGQQTAVLSGGCFWGMQLVFEHVTGVTSVTAGYAGGSAGTATYDQVSTGTTGHAEAVRITYDPSKISYGDLLKVFFAVAHDPTERDRQGPDVGSQYRSVIFYENEAQHRVAQEYIDQLDHAHTFSRPIVTEVVPLHGFYPAEDYHQDYAVHHPNDLYIAINDRPKVEHLRKALPELYRESRLP